MSTAGEVLIQGDEEVLVFEAVDLLGFHGLRNGIAQESIGHRTSKKARKSIEELGHDFEEKDHDHDHGDDQLADASG